ncbi:phosphatidylserine decarboxylase family protein [Dokdonia sp. LLG6352-1]|uniref:phosphatidylserine decarboxylase family protein n=1 Tax=Dokdonia sp. LLG6352-1 TaxID=3160831 RepID=UPI003865A5D0
MFHKEGYKIIVIALVIFTGLILLANKFLEKNWLFYLVALALGVLLYLILQFFRNPDRTAPLDSNVITSPVDGKVVVIEEVYEAEYFKDKRLQVSVFMSPLNVHVTRYPSGGKIAYSKYHPGKYLVAWHPKSSTENERTTVVVSTEKFGDVLYRQIAGALAKRIINYAEEGQMVQQGEDSGFIRFGSRVDLYLPIGTKLDVELNQVVKGAQSVIASI